LAAPDDNKVPDILLGPLALEVEAVIQRVVAQKGTPEDIETWARRLAEDVADLTD
jgi:hypothetical protein